MKSRQILLIGGGGHAAACLDVLRSRRDYVPFGVIEKTGIVKGSKSLCGLDVVGSDGELEKFAAAGHSFLIAFGHTGDPDRRIEIFNRLIALNADVPVITSAYAVISPEASIEKGTVVMHRAVVNCFAQVGENCIVNTGAIVEHHAIVEDHCHLAPGAIIGGEARIGTGSLIGAGAVILPGIKIANKTIIGAGAVVTRDVFEPGTYVGVPAKRVNRRTI